MSVRCALSAALAALTLCAGCAAKPALVPATSAAPAEASQPRVGAERTSCPRVARARRTWTGFLVDVPSDAMVRALEVVVPIQVALGELFCAPERADCRPSELQAIDLTDEHANVARLRLLLARDDDARELSLTLQTDGAAWSAQPESLAQYLALCRQARSDTAGTTR